MTVVTLASSNSDADARRPLLPRPAFASSTQAAMASIVSPQRRAADFIRHCPSTSPTAPSISAASLRPSTPCFVALLLPTSSLFCFSYAAATISFGRVLVEVVDCRFEFVKEGAEKGGVTTVMQYEMRFFELVRHAIWLVPTDRERIRRLVDGLTYQLQILMTRERVCGVSFEEVVDIARDIESIRRQERVEREGKRPRGSGSFGGVPSGSQFHHGKGRSFSAIPTQGSSRAPSVQGSSMGGPAQQSGQAGSLAPVTSPPSQSARGRAQSAKGRPRGGGRSGGGQACCYTLPTIPDAIASDAVFTDMPYESLASSIYVSTLMGDTIIVDRMDWLSPYHTILDYHTKTVMLAMPGLPRIMWRGSLDYVPSRVISYLKAQQMVGKGCLSYLAFVRDVSVETPTIDSIPVVRDFSDVFPADLLGMPLDRDIDFDIDLVSGTQPISISPYRMAPSELKELKEQFQELLEKGLITPRVSPWGAPVLFVKKNDVALLGNVVSSEGIQVDLKKGFSSIASPLTKFTQMGSPFRWWDECETSFQKLKTALTTTPVLVLPSASGSYSKVRVIAYAYRQLNSYEKNYLVHDLDLAAIVHTLKIWRHYLYGVSCEVFTDHLSPQHLFKQKDINLRQCRWLELLKDYDITILYHLGKANVVIDALSRKQ
ncbi:uncharacterized protein [Nicotiana sylvestris]|uniref:uncharacterized protein n=1 Tax=Nicotiana sylvestris TaxID=4096 RepID=UPI00388CC5D8